MTTARPNLFGIILWSLVLLAPTSLADDAVPIFETDVLPMFAARCGKCHGEGVQKGGLDLSNIDGLRRGGESGQEVVGDTLEESLLWTLVQSGDMPPPGQMPLNDQQRELIRRWITSGAKSQHASGKVVKPITQHDVLPIVLLRCTTCHGPRLRQAGLDLRTPAAMLRGGKNGPAMIAGDPDASLMIQRIESEACPPRELLLKFFVKRPPKSEVQTLRDWIAAGAPLSDQTPDVATTEPDPMVTDEDRAHWSFQPPRKSQLADSIDGFVLKKLNAVGLNFAAQADRDTLIRRAHLDLIGMPPSVQQWQGWRDSDDPNWYRDMIDQLLSSPRYGERWGRYWLDLAGYADSEGGVSADPIRPVAWKYRDYVINAFNSDQPYDRFLTEQIAGDELLDFQKASTITEEMVEHLIATGFLRMGIDQTGSRTMNFVPERLGVISDAIAVLGSGVMGLTMECARCHSHKYDPIPQRDYYRFKAILQGALDEHDWLSFKTRSVDMDTRERRARIAAVNPPLQAELKTLESRRKKSMASLQTELLRQSYPEQSEADRAATLLALRTADNNRTLPQRILVEKLQQAELIPDSELGESVLAARRAVEAIDRDMTDIRRRMEPPLAIRALWDRGQPSPTYVLLRGEHHKPGRLVGPGVPSVLTDGRTPFAVAPPFPNGTPKTGRRLALAQWLTQPDHPLTSRVMANRIWYHHFGTGLVNTLENFGVQGDRPSHPELLDWLAIEFVQRGWSVKEMHRMIMNSRVYRQSSRITERQAKLDPHNRLLSRMSLRRMDAEALRDSLLFVAGRLDDRAGGPPDGVAVDNDGMVSAVSTDGRWRRSVYLQYRRTELPTMMDTFDYPEMGPNCISRNQSTVSPQSLMLMNNHHVRQLARSLAIRIEQSVSDHDQLGKRIDAVYKIALNRPPTDQQRQIGVQSLQQLQSDWQGDTTAALETYCHTILNSAAFLYVD